eukprot:scaffold2179_cov165-Amphora_coffeaeformis.AAC.22
MPPFNQKNKVTMHRANYDYIPCHFATKQGFPVDRTGLTPVGETLKPGIIISTDDEDVLWWTEQHDAFPSHRQKK